MVRTKRKRKGNTGVQTGAKRSRYVGVCWHKREQKWAAKIKVHNVSQHLGFFLDEADGARAYDAAVAAQNLHRAFNFPDDTEAERAAGAADRATAKTVGEAERARIKAEKKAAYAALSAGDQKLVDAANAAVAARWKTFTERRNLYASSSSATVWVGAWVGAVGAWVGANY
jgi:hypothetical protein